MRGHSCDGKSARDMAATGECRFLFRALKVADDEEAIARAGAVLARLQLVLVQWSKLGHVNCLRSCRAFVLVSQNQLSRLLEDMHNIGAERVYDDVHGSLPPHAQIRAPSRPAADSSTGKEAGVLNCAGGGRLTLAEAGGSR